MKANGPKMLLGLLSKLVHEVASIRVPLKDLQGKHGIMLVSAQQSNELCTLQPSHLLLFCDICKAVAAMHVYAQL